MDLGSILSTIGSIATTYQDIRAPRPAYQTTPVGNWPGGTMPVPAGMDIPFVDCIPEPPACTTNDHYWSTRANNGQGGWVKYRRRRKKLATKSDISDLASLKTVLSPADMKMWIATHS